ncbi:20850_t:CDS:2 [Cetraspora pellucida]|uniref:20850_t:CDS:1 n=1 Tax=Cetraspora pellucida TaxID=1433469 RepID=A0A9N9FZK8_9GLOM|nr:20850_t:CDS:2 [Cetraspora pellucida]
MGFFDKEVQEIYDGKDIRELNDIFIKDEEIAEKLRKLIQKAHKKILEDSKVSTGDDEEVATNRVGNVRFKSDIVNIESFQQLQDVMKTSVKENKHVKAVGSFAAFSKVAETNGYLLKPSKTSNISKTDLNLLNEDAISQAKKDDIVYYDVKWGTKIYEILPALKKDNRAFFNVGGWTGQDIIGVNATSTHGSGVTLPPLCSFVVSVLMVAPGEKIYKVEPTKGITDASKFTQKFPNINLIQDDETFHAAVVNIGALGVTYEVTISTIPLFSIIERREETTWTNAKSVLKQKPYSINPYLKYRNVEVWISPYTDYALITLRDLAANEDVKMYPKSEAKMLFQEFIELPVVQEITKVLSITAGGALYLLLHLFSAFVPFINEEALRSQNHKDPIVDSYELVYNSLGPGFVNDFKVISVEFSFSTKDDNHIVATDAILKTLKELRDKHNLNIHGPASMRFSAASSQYLSMGNGKGDETRAYLEMIILDVWIDHYKRVFDTLTETAVKHNARCHWGQYFSPKLDHKYLMNAYGDQNVLSFIKQIKKFDPNGIMSNPLLKKLGLTPDGKVTDFGIFEVWGEKFQDGVDEFFKTMKNIVN